MKNLLLTVSFLSILISSSFIVAAETAEEKGLAIAIEADKRDTGFKDSTVKLQMELKNKQGKTSQRHLRTKTLEVIGDGDKSLSIFDKPTDIKGTAFLTYSHTIKADDQWLYLPALKRVKRISSKNKSGPFMGSEFSYEDISSQEVDKYTYKYIKDEVLDGINYFVVERYPTYKNSGYSRQVAWINKQEYRPKKIVFYDRKNALLKTLIYKDYKQYLGKYWRADIMQMNNHQTAKSTELSFKDYKFNTGITAKKFTRNSLKRAK